ncbi:hypothetical protein EDD29_6141 [Actinocorallia herbida]|uniref:Uncharacterized protein n=1 Tax=Actinocorallia herbida TaxID=58109 RepID=A0A3N1D4J9_9ACTN|nr:hypothetical protein [Actinocorallia herbida]ROO88472.1 hypothetical protein EDD29_6141 [Actinocorallia herbida]
MVDHTAGPQSDPGFAASLRTPTVLGNLRRSFLMLSVMPVVVFALSPFIVRIETHILDTPPLWSAAAVPLLALAVLWLAPRLPLPLPPRGTDLLVAPGKTDAAGNADERAARRVSDAFRGALFLRFALTEGVVLAGLPLAMASDSLLPMALAFGFGYPLVLTLALPTRGTIERIRRRLGPEADGRLWAALLDPYQPRLSVE